ncbi:MAG: TIGR00159 family protein [Ruminococcaceae bacterium]|nr:TIGR00159 family protein [Oscillospiraceae bacterium]
MKSFLDGLLIVIREIGLNDIIDMAIIAFMIYKLLIFIRESRAQLIAKGILVIVAAYAAASVFRLQMVSVFVDMIVRNAAIALIVIFQPELRSVLEKVGRSSISVRSLFNADNDDAQRAEKLNTIANVVESARVLKGKFMGALIVFECEVKLGDIIASGISMDATPNVSLITNIFFDKAPLHDGAMIIRDNRIVAASCYLPLTHRTDIDANLGTRHRAAIGLSEICDAVIVVVSEETGRFTVCHNGDFHSTFDVTELSEQLIKLLIPDDGSDENNGENGLGAQLSKIFRRNDMARIKGRRNNGADTEENDEAAAAAEVNEQ